MNLKYQSHPPWRSQWSAILLTMALVLICTYFGNQIIASGAGATPWQQLALGGCVPRPPSCFSQ